MLVEAIGDVGGVGVLGACEVSDGFAWGGEGFGGGELVVGLFGFGACGVEGRGVDELLEVVYWMCVVALPIGLPYLAMCDDCRSADRDTRWVFCFSEGVGVGMFKMADFRPPPMLWERGWGCGLPRRLAKRLVRRRTIAPAAGISYRTTRRNTAQ